jgi:hypothetical protein
MHLLFGFFLFCFFSAISLCSLTDVLKEKLMNPYRTESFNALLALNTGAFEAATSISSPVRGLRAFRAARSFTSNVPKPTICILSPFCSVSVTVSIKAPVNASESFLVTPGFLASAV